MLDSLPKLIVRYTEILKQIADKAPPRKIVVDRETRRLRFPPAYSAVLLCGVPVQPLLDAYHGMERICPDEAFAAWDEMGLAIYRDAPPSTVRGIAERVFPAHGFPLDSLAVATHFLHLCLRANLGREIGHRKGEFGLCSDFTRIGLTKRMLYFSKPQTLRDRRGREFRSQAVGISGLKRFDFEAALSTERRPIVIRPTLAGVRAMLIQAAPDERPGIDIVLSVVIATGHRLDIDAPITKPSPYEKLITEGLDIEEAPSAPPLYDEWEPLRRLIRNAKYDPTADLYTALKDLSYRDFVGMFGVPRTYGVVQPYTEKLREKHLAALDLLSGKVSKDDNPEVEDALALQQLISRLV